jgi:hypothetical protein
MFSLLIETFLLQDIMNSNFITLLLYMLLIFYLIPFKKYKKLRLGGSKRSLSLSKYLSFIDEYTKQTHMDSIQIYH